MEASGYRRRYLKNFAEPDDVIGGDNSDETAKPLQSAPFVAISKAGTVHGSTSSIYV